MEKGKPSYYCNKSGRSGRSRALTPKNGTGRVKRKEAVQCLFMVLIPLIGFLVLTVYPILWSFRWSVYSYSGISSEAIFVGFKNFAALAHDATYWNTWINTLQFALLKVPVEMVLAMFIALLLMRKIKGAGFFRTVFYIPNIISVVVIGLIFTNMFSFFGVINSILEKTGILSQGIDWFADKTTAMAVLLIGSIWNTFGINVMYFMAALSNVSEEVYESARLDGASKAVMFFKITLPMIIPMVQTVLLLSVIGTLSVNEYILVLTNGGPGGQTQSVMSYLTSQFVPGFTSSPTLALGYGCAMSLVTTLIFVFVALVYNAVNKRIKSIY